MALQKDKMPDIDAASLVGGAGEINISGSGKAEAKESSVEVVQPDDMELAVFMEDVLDVWISEPSREDAPRLEWLNVQGKVQGIRLNNSVQKLRRYYVEALARAKRVAYRQVVKKDDFTGEPINKMIPRVAPKYNFSVVHDPRGRQGVEWLSKILSDKV